MSGQEQEGESARCPIPGKIVDEQDTVPYAKKYVEFKCGFKDREGKSACDWTTTLMSRKAANQLLGEHWTSNHEDDFQLIQKEKEVERERFYQEQMDKLKKDEQDAEIKRENELFQLRADNAAKLKRIQAGIATKEDLNGIDSENVMKKTMITKLECSNQEM